MAFFLAWLDRKVGFNLEWLMRFCQAPWLYHHCSLSVQQPGKPGRHSVAQNHSPGKKLTGRTSARYTSMALSLEYWQFKRLNQKYVCLGDTHCFQSLCKWLTTSELFKLMFFQRKLFKDKICTKSFFSNLF